MHTETLNTALFGSLVIEKESKDEGVARRLKIARKALDAKSQAFRDAYSKFAIEFAQDHETFLAEDITAAYKLTKFPKPYSKNPKNAWKSTGAIIHKLLKEGYLDYYREGGFKKFRYSRGGERQMVILTKGKAIKEVLKIF